MFLLCSTQEIITSRPEGALMLELPAAARTFRLRSGGVSCDLDGLFVGQTPLLSAKKTLSGAAEWSVRSESDLNIELSTLYGLPIGVATKIDGLVRVARALNANDFVTASIAALHLQL